MKTVAQYIHTGFTDSEQKHGKKFSLFFGKNVVTNEKVNEKVGLKLNNFDERLRNIECFQSRTLYISWIHTSIHYALPL